MPSRVARTISKPGSERAILSMVLADNDKLAECEQHDLYAAHFFVPGNQILYSAINYLYQRADISSIDSLVLYSTIEDPQAKAKVDELGGMGYIDALMQSTIMDNLGFYINQVRNCAIRRMAYDMGGDIQNTVINANPDTPVSELLNDIQQQTLNLVLQNEEDTEMYVMGQDTEDVLEQRANNPNTIPGYAVGWEKYDRQTQGYQGNDLTVVVARSKVGKSAWLLNHAHKFAIEDGLPVLYIDTEMTSRQQEDRILSIISSVPYEEIVNGMFSQDTVHGTGEIKTQALYDALAKIRAANLYHIYMPSFSIEKVSAIVRQKHLRHNLAVVIFDYIKMPTSEVNSLDNAQEYQKLGFITTCLKDLSGICDIPVITAAQANRSSSESDESAIGGSYRILHMATRLVFIRNKTDAELMTEGFDQGNIKMTVAFQRNGSSGGQDINIMFDKPTLRMTEV